LKKKILSLPNKIDTLVFESKIFKINKDGNNFSFGEKQLICLSRCLLKKSKILILDEATSNIDQGNDSIIQNSLKKYFKNLTIIIIAHRIETILDCDKIMKIDNGVIVDFDTPNNLKLKNII
jgi:ABC-type multidrug transport system fused ATPase/permease subunit